MQRFNVFFVIKRANKKQMVHACWWYYFSKFTEFFDTVSKNVHLSDLVFVLSKHSQQKLSIHRSSLCYVKRRVKCRHFTWYTTASCQCRVSLTENLSRHQVYLKFDHVTFLVFTVWFGVKFTPGGHSTFFGLLNTAVHIVMYTYYLFAAMGPQYQKYLWWKKYLTGLQMVSNSLRFPWETRKLFLRILILINEFQIEDWELLVALERYLFHWEKWNFTLKWQKFT